MNGNDRRRALFDDQRFLDTLPPEEAEALRAYKRLEPYRDAPDYARWLNGALLHGQPDAEAERAARLLDRATRRFRLPEPRTLYRATFDVVMARYDAAAFVYPAYMSVSRSDRSLARHFNPERPGCTGILLRIHCRAGTPMALLEWTHAPDGADEGECLLPRNAHYVVTRKRRGSPGDLLRYAGPECAERLNGLAIWDMTVETPP